MENDTNCFYNDYIQDEDFYDKKLSLEEIEYLEKLSEYELSEKDFYPPEDTRVLHSGVDDIIGGDNFVDFTTDIFDIYDEEEYFDD